MRRSRAGPAGVWAARRRAPDCWRGGNLRGGPATGVKNRGLGGPGTRCRPASCGWPRAAHRAMCTPAGASTSSACPAGGERPEGCDRRGCEGRAPAGARWGARGRAPGRAVGRCGGGRGGGGVQPAPMRRAPLCLGPPLGTAAARRGPWGEVRGAERGVSTACEGGGVAKPPRRGAHGLRCARVAAQTAATFGTCGLTAAPGLCPLDSRSASCQVNITGACASQPSAAARDPGAMYAF